MANAIEVRGLKKLYGDLAAVNGIDFGVAAGEVFAFLGPNGAGKTTTVEILEGLRNRTEGTIEVLGRDPWSDGAVLHTRIGVIPQDFRFLEKIHPLEAIDYYSHLFGVPSKGMELLRRVGLSDKAHANFDNLSGGQKQKLGLALSLVNDPELCFLDEPTTGLDPQARRSIWEVIRQLKSDGRTVFLTTHYLEEAELLADRVAIINHGKIIAAGRPSEIIQRLGGPGHLKVAAPPALAEYLRSRVDLPITSANGSVEVEIREKHDVLRVLTEIERSGIPWDDFMLRHDTLEDVFVHLVGQMDDGVLKSEAST